MTSISWLDFRKKASEGTVRIALADAQDPRVIEAADRARLERIADPLLVDSQKLSTREVEEMVDELLRLPKFKMLSRKEAKTRIQDSLILGCLYLKRGMADGFIGGATRTTAETLRAVFSIIGLAPKASTLFGFFFIEAQNGRLVVLADCAVTPDPSAKQLAHIGIGAAQAYTFFTGNPAKVAFLSFSTEGSAEHPVVDKIRQALVIAHEKAPALVADGEWQSDAALDLFSAQIKGVGNSPMAGQANVLITPDLNCGNIAYKLVQRLGGCRAVGPVLWGTALPANDLSRGCSMEDVLDMLALTALQASKTKDLEKIAHAR